MTPGRSPSSFESALAALWAAALGRSEVSFTASFRELGGDDELAIELVDMAREAFGATIPAAVLSDGAITVPSMAAVIRAEVQNVGRKSRPRADVPSRAPLSFGQQRLWILWSFMPESAAYNVPTAFWLHGEIQVTALGAALVAVVDRHPILRTRIGFTDDGSPCQLVDAHSSTELCVVNRPGIGRQEALAWARSQAREGFDLERGPVVRSTLLRYGPDESIFVLTIHHIAIDGWSREIVLRELSEAYSAISAGQQPLFPPLAESYVDFAVRQREQATEAALEGELTYWRSRLQGAPIGLPLPTDRPRRTEADLCGEAVDFTIPVHVVEGLRTLGRIQQSTLFMVLLAAVHSLLAGLCGVSRTLVGVIANGRTQPQVQETVGFFVNTVPVLGDSSGDPPFSVLLARVREEALGAYVHQIAPFERLVKEFDGNRDGSRNPLVDVLVQMEPDDPVLDLVDVVAAPIENLEGGVRADLEVHFHEGSRGVYGQLVYATALFDNVTARSVMEKLMAVLSRIVEEPDTRVTDLCTGGIVSGDGRG